MNIKQTEARRRGAELKKWRRRKGMTQEEFATSIGANHSTVCRWEAPGALPHDSQVRIIATVYPDCPVLKGRTVAPLAVATK